MSHLKECFQENNQVNSRGLTVEGVCLARIGNLQEPAVILYDWRIGRSHFASHSNLLTCIAKNNEHLPAYQRGEQILRNAIRILGDNWGEVQKNPDFAKSVLIARFKTLGHPKLERKK